MSNLLKAPPQPAETIDIQSVRRAAQAPDPAASIAGKIRFAKGEGFQKVIKQRVDAYFRETKQSPRDLPSMYLKTATILVWVVCSYLLLVFAPLTLPMALGVATFLALGLAGVGFNIQHDGGHKGYSNRPWVNKLMAIFMDAIGGSSYLWNIKHNMMHHIYANIDGFDDDINIGALGRLAPAQKHYWPHRFQHIYMWFLYGFMALKWHLVDDFVNVATGRMNGHRIPRPRGMQWVIFFGGKLTLLTYAFVIPMLFHSWPVVVGFYLFTVGLQGVVMACVFQLAHCVEEAAFPLPNATGQMESEWMAHQLDTTVDFARFNPVICWYLGGLNLQAIHHLFPQVCHIHYPKISLIVEETCKEMGFPYKTHPSVMSALRSHYMWLKRMGKGEAAVAEPTEIAA